MSQHRKPSPARSFRRMFPTLDTLDRGNFGAEEAKPRKPRHPDGLDTLRVPAGKAIETHLAHIAEFWQPGSPPHQLATAALDKIKQLTAERDVAWGQCAAAFGEPLAGKGTLAAKAAAVAEIERRLAAAFPPGNALGVRLVGVTIDGDLASLQVVMPPQLERIAIPAPAANEDAEAAHG